jgi:uncharacterized membrane protein YadS
MGWPFTRVAAASRRGIWRQVIEQFIARYGKTHHLVLPNIEYVLWAILIGLIVANAVGVPASCRRGIATYDFWLKTGIVLLGARFILDDIARLGGISLALVFIEILLALAFMTWLGKRFKLAPKLVSLLYVAASVCGVSAIIATQGAIEADESGKEAASLPLPPLRTGLDGFPSSGSSRV